ncbi:Carboxypeptidase D [Monoraphidium neglectum]|uniref:Carboxypeptidase D n=1 Tax=Monoraphidium neglectum TaxID=145388 RepID=A0A0D2M3J1_9CHLO|nr:Carboxypeptidase D [Monoraphidium neglectum]KIY98129.1 Carboxypeptidase D [Monoraphidium neglectum]|eukprot:XP_013897149.1 Carboxypeptidase D [Monoraphidium neglectum]
MVSRRIPLDGRAALCVTLVVLLVLTILPSPAQASWAKEFVTRCGSIAMLHSVGKSARGTKLWVLEISDRPGVEEPEPNFRYVANMHGDEISGR